MFVFVSLSFLWKFFSSVTCHGVLKAKTFVSVPTTHHSSFIFGVKRALADPEWISEKITVDWSKTLARPTINIVSNLFLIYSSFKLYMISWAKICVFVFLRFLSMFWSSEKWKPSTMPCHVRFIWKKNGLSVKINAGRRRPVVTCTKKKYQVFGVSSVSLIGSKNPTSICQFTS